MSAVIATIPVGSFPSGVAVRNRNLALGRYPNAYTANHHGDSVSVIDTAANTVLTTISDVDVALAVRVSADGTRAYVRCLQGVSVIDTATNTITASIVHASEGPSLAISPDNAHLYLPDVSTVAVIDTATHAVTATIAVGTGVTDVEVSPDGAHVYTANAPDDTVSVIDTATHTVTATIAVGRHPWAVAVSPDSTRIYIANSFYESIGTGTGQGTVSVIDAATNAVVATIAVGSVPMAVAVSPDGTRVYVTNFWDGVVMSEGKVVSETGGTVSVINAATNAVIETITVGRTPTGVAVNPSGTRVYVSNGGDNTVSVIKIESDFSAALKMKIAELIGAADRGGGGWAVIGNNFIPIPPRSPSLAVMAKTAAIHLDEAIENPQLAEEVRRLRPNSG